MNAPLVILLAHGASTLMLVGLIWTVQRVHYPTFHHVAPAGFDAFAVFHQRRISLVVVPLMLVELATAVLLLVYRPAPLPSWWAMTGLALLALIWASTFAIQVPLHGRLARGHDERAIERLVKTNWLRTVLWTLRGMLVVWGLWTLLRAGSPAA